MDILGMIYCFHGRKRTVRYGLKNIEKLHKERL